MKTIDLKFAQLCDEIDYWKQEAEYYKSLYEDEVSQSNILAKERLLDAQKGVANALRFSLSVTDDENGNLVILKEDRSELAKSFN